jgi:hypothetical protein
MGEAWQQVLAESGTSVRGKRTVLRRCVDPALLPSGEQRSLQNRIGLCAVARDLTEQNMYWFVETISSRRFVEDRVAQLAS